MTAQPQRSRALVPLLETPQVSEITFVLVPAYRTARRWFNRQRTDLRDFNVQVEDVVAYIRYDAYLTKQRLAVAETYLNLRRQGFTCDETYTMLLREAGLLQDEWADSLRRGGSGGGSPLSQVVFRSALLKKATRSALKDLHPDYCLPLQAIFLARNFDVRQAFADTLEAAMTGDVNQAVSLALVVQTITPSQADREPLLGLAPQAAASHLRQAIHELFSRYAKLCSSERAALYVRVQASGGKDLSWRDELQADEERKAAPLRQRYAQQRSAILRLGPQDHAAMERLLTELEL